MQQDIQLILGDCLEEMKAIESGSVNLILCDLPYGTTACKWDSIIPFEPLWEQYKRVIKRNGAIVLTASQPFTTKLIASNMDLFKYCWYWKKNRVTGFQNAKKQPLRTIEDVCIFGGGSYNPQGLTRIDKKCRNGRSVGGDSLRKDVDASQDKGTLRTPGSEYIQEFTGYPNNILEFSSDTQKLHPTQKPVALFEYLIRTYTNEGDLVLDNCLGSGTTAIACLNTGRRCIGIEKDPGYFELAKRRIEDHQGHLFNGVA